MDVLDKALGDALGVVDGVDAVLRTPISGSHVVVYVVAREHGIVDRERLFDVEDGLVAAFPRLTFELVVRAHQGRPFESVAPHTRRLI
jgi:hypothetical protein